MATKIETNTYYKDDMIIRETIVDGDVFEIVEQYLDEEGEVIYEYKHDYSPAKLLQIHKELEAQKHDLDYYGAKGVIRVLNNNKRKAQEHERRMKEFAAAEAKRKEEEERLRAEEEARLEKLRLEEEAKLKAEQEKIRLAEEKRLQKEKNKEAYNKKMKNRKRGK